MDLEGLDIVDEIKIGIQAAGYDRASLLEYAQHVESSGLDSYWVADHISFHVPIIEAMSAVSFLAAATERIELGTGVLLLPLRHPTLVAKMSSTIDVLSTGRLLLGVGVGGEFPPEFDAVDVPIDERGPRTNESIEIIRRHWTEESVEYRGEHYSFGPVKLEPKPLRPGGPPIIVGGRKPVSMKRAGRLGDGYISHMCAVDTYRSNLTTIARHASDAGRSGMLFQTCALLFTVLDDSFETARDRAAEKLGRIYNTDFRDAAPKYCLLGKPEDCLEQMLRFVHAGCRHFVLSPLSDPTELIDRAAAEILPELRSAVG